jgi:hypothetical protein
MVREIQRSVLPIPDQPSFGLVTYDARGPDTSFPPVEPLRPPERAPNDNHDHLIDPERNCPHRFRPAVSSGACAERLEVRDDRSEPG